MKNNLFSFITILIVGITDQFTKFLISSNFSIGQVENIIPNVFNLVLTYNKGAAFGFLANIQNDTLRVSLLWAFSLIALCVVLYLLFNSHKESKYFRLGLSLILGGALGNMIDRFRLGQVVDFLDFFVNEYHWPAFNVADSAICVGVFLVILSGESASKPKEVVE